MARTPLCDKTGMRKGTWTAEEDNKLIAYVTRYGCWNWRQLPKFAGLARCGKSCRLRWMNYLRPNLKRGNFTPEEEDHIIKIHKNLGNRWSIIAAELPGRTDNEVKNHWHTTLKKRVQERTLPSIESSTPLSSNVPLSPLSSTSEFFSITSDCSITNEKLMLEDDFGFLDDLTEHEHNGSFWVDDFSYTPKGENIRNTDRADFQNENATHMKHDVSPNHSSNESTTSFVADNDLSIFYAYTEPTIDSLWTHPYAVDMSHVSTEFLTPLADESDYFNMMYDPDLWSSL